MPTFRIAAPCQSPTPTRVPTWNGTVRAGEDLKIAFLLLDEDGETPVHVNASRSQVTLAYEGPRGGYCHDYGMGWPAYGGRPAHAIAGQVVPQAVGRINFRLPAMDTGEFWGRYLMRIEVDQPDGVSTEIEGVLQVRPGPEGLGNAPRIYMQPGVTPIGTGLIAYGAVGDLPVDQDGFPVQQALYVVPPPVQGGGAGHAQTAILGTGILGQMVLGD